MGVDIKVVSVVLKFFALTLCMVGFGLVDKVDTFMNLHDDNRRSEDFMLVACNCYLIILIFMIIFQLVKGEFDRTLSLWFLFSGCSILLGAGGYYAGAIQLANKEAGQMKSMFEEVDYAACALVIVAGILLLADGIVTYKKISVTVTDV